MNNHTPNIYFINVAKTIAIFLMVLAHLSIPSEIHSFINSFHMPLFFIITGYLISVDIVSFKSFFVKKVHTLLIPYFIFACISFVFWYFLGGKYGNDADSGQDLSKYLTGILLAIPSKEYLGFNFPIWYLPSLFCVEILYYWVKKIFKKYYFFIVLLFVGLGILFNEINLVRLPFGIDVAFFSILFIHIGQWLKDKNRMNKYIVNPSLPTKIGLSLVFLCLTIFISQVNGNKDMDISMVLVKSDTLPDWNK